MQLEPSIFRAYDIRGIVKTQLTADVALEIGKAIGSYALEKKQGTLISGKDGRLTSPNLAMALPLIE